MSLQGPFDYPLYRYFYYPLNFGGMKFRKKYGLLPLGFFPSFASFRRFQAILTSFVTVTNATFFRSRKRFNYVSSLNHTTPYLGVKTFLPDSRLVHNIKFSSLIDPARILCHGSPFSFFRFKFAEYAPVVFYPREAFNFFYFARSPSSRTRYLTKKSKFYPRLYLGYINIKIRVFYGQGTTLFF